MSEPKIITKGPFLNFVERDGWQYITRSRGSLVVAIIALTDNKEIILIEQFRKPMNARVLELPAGLVGDNDHTEDAALAALRELEEETGYQADTNLLIRFGKPFAASSGLCDEVTQIFLCHSCKKVGKGGGIDPDENIQVHTVPQQEFMSWILQKQHDGVIVDARVLAAPIFFN